MLTYQDFKGLTVPLPEAVGQVIREHKGSRDYRVALDADRYDRQENTTITEFANKLFTARGDRVRDFTASNNRIASNLFHRLNTQRCMYSLGNGVTFAGEGAEGTKDALGDHFDHDIQQAAYLALIHGVSFAMHAAGRLHVFALTEFAPLWDERDGSLEAGVRFWRLSADSPLQAVLYEREGWTRFAGTEEAPDALRQDGEGRRPYGEEVRYTEADGIDAGEVVAVNVYSSLPVVPMWGSRLRQSTLVGLRQAIDAYDIIRSGFANDLSDCAEVYWLLNGTGGMSDEDLQRFRDRLKLTHVAVTDDRTDPESRVTPFTQEIPYQARQAFLEAMKAEIYEDFGALDVHTIAAGSTNDHIDAAYQPLDENASDFEFCVSEAVTQLLAVLGLPGEPVFKRQRISNQREQVEMLVQEAAWLDEETILRKLPNVAPSEVAGILERRSADETALMAAASTAPAVTVGISE